MAVKQILDMNDELVFPVEAILIKDWKNEERTQIGEVIPEEDNVYYIAREKKMVAWKTPNEFLNCTLSDGNLKSVIYVDKPLRTKDNNNSRPWDIAFAVSFGIVMFYEIFTGEWPELACVGIVAVALIYIGVCQENKAIKGFMVMGMVLLLIKLIIHLILGESIVSKTVFVDWNQMLILFVYFWLRYQPQMMPFSAFLKKAEVLRRLIYGKETWGHYFE